MSYVDAGGSVKKRADFKEAEKAAYNLIEEFGLDKPPIDPVALAEALGVKVYFAEFDEGDIAGFYDAEEVAIYVNKDEYPARQTFTIAHELGHHLLHREWANSTDYKVLLRESRDGDLPKDPYEQEADAFAAHLLVPRHMLRSYSPYASTSDLTRLFMVSAPVIRNRMKFEGISDN
jgi:Zn-dependent peptidase ImmA (M78 family)